MINDQLLDYVRQQLSLKVSREVIITNLKSTGWNEADINEAFRTVIPMQGFAPNSLTNNPPVSFSNYSTFQPSVVPKISKIKSSLGNMVFLIVGLACVVIWYFFEPQIANFWNSLSFPKFSMSSK